MDELYFRKVMSLIILIGLLLLSFFLIKPILMSIMIGLILAFLFSPIFDWIFKLTNSKNVSASFVSVILILLIILPIWFLTPIVLNQSVKFFMVSQQIDFVSILKKVFPSLFASQEFSAQIGSIIGSFVTKTTNSLMNSFADLILNFPTFFLQLVVVAFTFFFALRDKEILTEYVKSLIPFTKEVERKLFEYSKEITISVLYGQIVVGVFQGLIAGAGFFIFGVPNALLLTLLAMVGGVFPLVGTYIVWVPVVIYLFIAGNSSPAMGVFVFGIISSTIDNILRPIIISRRTRVSPSIIIIGMIGGVFLFGILGLIIGPLILAYLLIILELYRKKDSLKILVQGKELPS